MLLLLYKLARYLESELDPSGTTEMFPNIKIMLPLSQFSLYGFICALKVLALDHVDHI